MRKVHNGRAGFTLIELMIVVTILGVLAALAIPQFIDYLHESKASEASMNLSKLFDGASAYYTREFTVRGVDVDAPGPQSRTHCTVGSRRDGTSPTAEKHAFPNHRDELADPEFRVLKFSLNSPVYYSYEIVNDRNESGDCGIRAGENNVYTFLAKGDLDGDGEPAEYELAVGTDEDNNLYHAAGVYRVTEEGVW